MSDTENADYVSRKATIDVSVGGKLVDTRYPERRFYKASQQGTSEVAIRRRLNEDLYLNFAGANDPKKATIQAYVFPLVNWIWIGFWILFGGTVVCLIPSKVRMQYARTEVVGIARNYAEIQK
jgi:cytochrome c-type biogenesis protein CcmF